MSSFHTLCFAFLLSYINFVLPLFLLPPAPPSRAARPTAAAEANKSWKLFPRLSSAAALLRHVRPAARRSQGAARASLRSPNAESLTPNSVANLAADIRHHECVGPFPIDKCIIFNLIVIRIWIHDGFSMALNLWSGRVDAVSLRMSLIRPPPIIRSEPRPLAPPICSD